MDRGTPSASDLADAGDVFRRERLRRRISIAQVANETKIRTSILFAIEEGSPRELPTTVFAKGLIRNYARYLGVDPRPYLAAYAELVPDSRAAVHSEQRRGSVGSIRALPGVIVPIVVAAIVVLLGGYLYQQYTVFVSDPSIVAARPASQSILISTPLPSPPAVARVAAPTSVAVRPAPLPTLAATPVAPTAIPTPTVAIFILPTSTPISGVHIDAVVLARVWIQVEVDGKVSFAGILNPGDRRSWTASQKIMVWSGNASSLAVTFNGKPVGSLGAPGEVVKVTWTATS